MLLIKRTGIKRIEKIGAHYHAGHHVITCVCQGSNIYLKSKNKRNNTLCLDVIVERRMSIWVVGMRR